MHGHYPNCVLNFTHINLICSHNKGGFYVQIYDSKLKLDTGYGAVWERMDHYHDKRHHTSWSLSRDKARHGMKLTRKTWVFILRRYKWHIHAGSWSLVNCWREGSTLPYKGCSWILMNAAVGHMDGSALMVIGVSAWYPDIPLSPWKKRLCLHAKKILLEIYYGP